MHAGDEWKALVILALAAEQGSPAGQHNLGFTLQRTKSFDMPGRQAAFFDCPIVLALPIAWISTSPTSPENRLHAGPEYLLMLLD